MCVCVCCYIVIVIVAYMCGRCTLAKFCWQNRYKEVTLDK